MGFIKTTFTLTGLTGDIYSSASSAMTASLTKTAHVRSEETPESVGLDFHDVNFTSQWDDPQLSGWVISPQTFRPTHFNGRPCNHSWVFLDNHGSRRQHQSQ
ncbi:MAG: hypothetical protein OSB68_00080 [Dehalococcoidia bacterium]|nr:hypothetical protein [Dehalococcoidia bacterium]